MHLATIIGSMHTRAPSGLRAIDLTFLRNNLMSEGLYASQPKTNCRMTRYYDICRHAMKERQPDVASDMLVPAEQMHGGSCRSISRIEIV